MTRDNPRYTDEDNIIFHGTNSEILAFYEQALAQAFNILATANAITF